MLMHLQKSIQQFFFRRIKAQSSPITLQHKTVYVLPTRHGIMFAVVLFIMLLGSLNYSNSMGFLLTFLLSGVYLVAMLQTYRSILKLKITLTKIKPVFKGDIAMVSLHLASDIADSVAGIKARSQDDEGHYKHSRSDNENLSHITLPIKTKKRGYNPIGRIRLWTEMPFGLFYVWAWIEPQATILAYPAPSNRHLPIPATNVDGNSNASHSAGDDEYYGVRNYHHSDPPSRIAWKALARTDETMTKEFSGAQSKEVWLDWYALNSHDTEQRLSQLTRWILDLEQTQTSYGLRLPDTRIQPASGKSHQYQCLTALALFQEK